MDEAKTEYYGYGVGGGKNINYYKVNYDENIVVFDNVPTYPIYLEYLSNGITVDSEISIPRKLFNALLAGIMYQLSLEDATAPFNKTEQLRRNYVSQMLVVRADKEGFTKDEYLDTFYKNAKQTPKR